MATRLEQNVRYWLTPTGCVAAGGHTPIPNDPSRCQSCGAPIAEEH